MATSNIHLRNIFGDLDLFNSVATTVMEASHKFLIDGDCYWWSITFAIASIMAFFFFIQNELDNVEFKPQKNLIDTTLFLSGCQSPFYLIFLLF